VIVAESFRGRRFVGRLDRGVDLFGSLLQLCRERHITTCELRAIGSLEAVELSDYDQAGKAWRPARKFSGGFELLQLTGNVSEKDGQLTVHAHASLMRDRDTGIELLGGHVVAARVFAVEFVLECFDDVLLRRANDDATGLTLWREAVALPNAAPVTPPLAASAPAAPAVAAPAAAAKAEPQPPPARTVPVAPPSATTLVPESAGAPGWAEVAAASAQRPAPAADPMAGIASDADDPIKLGDIIEHPKFGRGDVQRLEGADEYVHVRIASGRLVRLSLDVLKLTMVRREGKRRVFRAHVE
jgi:predicted DNA-binding protein with PD1-like motif